jgi:Domain of unknown function (DUF4328)
MDRARVGPVAGPADGGGGPVIAIAAVNGPGLRRDLRYQAFYPTVGMLGVTIATNLTFIAVDAAAGVPANWTKPSVTAWLGNTVLTGFFFLLWFGAARRNAATYPPGGVGAFRNWTVSGWICPVINLWAPYRMLADLLRASAPPEDDPGTVLASPGHGRAAIALLRWWCGLWHAMWAAACLTAVASSVTDAPRLVDVTFQALSAAAAACAIGVVVTATRMQAKRAPGPYAEPASLPRAAPGVFWFTLVAFTVVVVMFLQFAPHWFDTAARDLIVP